MNNRQPYGSLWPLNTWPKCAPPSGGGLRVSTIFVTTTRKRKLRPPQDT